MDSAVVITTKDRIDYLERAVKSVFSQTLLPAELVIIDDCSVHQLPDNLLKRFQELAIQRNINFNYIYNSESKGGNYSRNLGIKTTSSSIVHFLDDDDYWLNGKIKDQLEQFESNEKVGLVFTGKCFVQDTDLDIIKRKSRHKKLEGSIWNGNYVGSTSGVAVKREFLERTKGFDNNLQSLQDYDLWIRVLELTKGIWDTKHNLIYTVHSNVSKQITGNVDKHLNTVAYLKEKYKQKLKTIPSKDRKVFESRLEHVLARAYRSQKSNRYIKHALASLWLHPSIRTFLLFFNIK
ncbi:glycosyltransferase family 2 protein [Pseudoalteromonas arctica]|jgi:glycosyltransferase involved in cell wall biosynthesis|uniref:Glycosyltransferase family 2 protein n=1 Tax=Pseudoalteromonas arctica TaxID=394751 RepID=A0A7X9U8T0_9GAMM|nr:glycosyltransferase family A protein [Pseudoalteromonas arctica]NMF49608.1 glycosyltransferase family 2 protein [Pseudoalteromonas arctica]